MIEKICNILTNKIRKKMPEIDAERAEVINYGLQNVIGEIPKVILLFVIGFLLGVGELTLLSFFIILPYRTLAGGFHLRTHLGCIICTNLMYCGNALISKYIILEPVYIKYILIAFTWVFGMCMCKLYAPADTEDVPILRKKERKIKKILSYITLSICLIIAIFVENSQISNLIIFGMLIESITITRFAYKLTNNKYGYEIYEKQETTNIA